MFTYNGPEGRRYILLHTTTCQPAAQEALALGYRSQHWLFLVICYTYITSITENPEILVGIYLRHLSLKKKVNIICKSSQKPSKVIITFHNMLNMSK